AALHVGAHEQLGAFGAAVVLDALGLALHVVVGAFAALAEGGQAPAGGGGDAGLEAVGALGDHQLVAADLQRALGEDDVALENVGLVAVIDSDVIGFDIDRLFAV